MIPVSPRVVWIRALANCADFGPAKTEGVKKGQIVRGVYSVKSMMSGEFAESVSSPEPCVRWTLWNSGVLHEFEIVTPLGLLAECAE